MPLVFQIKGTNSTPAVKDCTGPNNSNVWHDGINRLTWNKIDRTAFAYNYLCLQRSTVDNVPPYFPSYTQVNVPQGPKPDTLWTKVREWQNGEIIAGSEPASYDDVVPHSTFYRYRIIWQVRASLPGPNDTVSEIDSGICTVVQPFDLSICTTDSCTIPQQCTNRLVWDVPILYVPFITDITHVPASTCCSDPCDGAGCYKITHNWTSTPNNPTEYWVYKSYDGVNFVKRTVAPFVAANTLTDWYDSDSHHGIFYRFDAQRPHGSIIPSQVAYATY